MVAILEITMLIASYGAIAAEEVVNQMREDVINGC